MGLPSSASRVAVARATVLPVNNFFNGAQLNVGNVLQAVDGVDARTEIAGGGGYGLNGALVISHG
jgi:hypothetical protein